MEPSKLLREKSMQSGAFRRVYLSYHGAIGESHDTITDRRPAVAYSPGSVVAECHGLSAGVRGGVTRCGMGAGATRMAMHAGLYAIMVVGVLTGLGAMFVSRRGGWGMAAHRSNRRTPGEFMDGVVVLSVYDR